MSGQRDTRTLGERAADWIAAVAGSWPALFLQFTAYAIWITVNSLDRFQHWDVYPYVLLNLFLSFQAAFTGPIIMISNRRPEQLQRQQTLYMVATMRALKQLAEAQRDRLQQLLDDEV